MSAYQSHGLFWRIVARVWPPRVAELDGLIVPLAELPIPARLKRRIAAGRYETHERRLLQGFLTLGDRVLELGASIGILSSIVRSRIGKEGRLVAVEANQALASSFHKQMSANGFECELITCACTPTWGPCRSGSQYSGLSHDGNNLVGRLVEGVSGAEETFALKSAGEICHQIGFHPNAVICDIEGAECVWATEAKTIPSEVEKILVELHPWLDGCEKAGQTLAALCRVGFEVYAMSGTVFDLRRVAVFPAVDSVGRPGLTNDNE